jgi:hypothetical protein
MPCVLPSGLLVISVDAVPAGGMQQSAGRFASALLKLLGRYELSVSWASEDPLCGESQAAMEQGHELALGAAAEWMSEKRSVFGRAVAPRLLAAMARKVRISTLALPPLATCLHGDLLVRMGITAVRSATCARELRRGRGWLRLVAASTRGDLRWPSPIRWGLWDIPATHSLADDSQGQIVRAIDRAAECGQWVHLLIDEGRLLNKAGLARCEKVLQHAAAGIRRGLLQNWTVAELAARLAQPREIKPARSILRKAA